MDQLNPNQLHALEAMLVFMPLFLLGIAAIMLIPYWVIWKKAGFSPWFSLLMLVPMLNFVMLYVLAFSEWKVVPIAQPTPPYPYPYPPSSLPPQA